MRKCIACFQEKTEDEFRNRKFKSGNTGKIGTCRSCLKARAAQWREAHKDDSLRYRKNYKKKARVWSEVNAEHVRSYNWVMTLKRKYQITPEEYFAALERQGYACAICGRVGPEKRKGLLCVDHDHKTGEVRGLLCSPCNTAIGMLKDNPQAVWEASRYLRGDRAPFFGWLIHGLIKKVVVPGYPYQTGGAYA